MSCDLLFVFFRDCPFHKFDLKSQDNITGLKNQVKIITLPKFKLGIKQSEVVSTVLISCDLKLDILGGFISTFLFALFCVAFFNQLTDLLLITKERWRYEK